MDWLQHVFTLLATALGGGLVMLGDWIRTRHQKESKRAETLVRLYTDFLVAFQAALHGNEKYYSHLASLAKGLDPPDLAEGHGTKTREAEEEFRKAAWALRLYERDATQQQRIEAIVNAFDDEPGPEPGEWEDFALSYSQSAKELRDKIRGIVDRMQEIHRKTLHHV